MNQGGMTQDQVKEAAAGSSASNWASTSRRRQFLNWMKGIVTQGEFGYSFAYRRDVGELIGERLP